MHSEVRRLFDFIMGGCSGFCFFFGGLIGNGLGTLMLITFIVSAYRSRMLNKIDKDLAKELRENKK